LAEVVPPAGLGATLANWRTAPFLQWSFQHVREIVPTARVSRGSGAITEIPEALDSVADIVLSQVSGGTTTIGEVVESTYTDGFLVIHDGRILAEEYRGGMAPDALHALMSVTKSFVGAVAAVLIDRGALDPTSYLTAFVPELAVSGYEGATVRHVLDMRSGITFSEDYLNSYSEIRQLQQCIGWAPGTYLDMPRSMYDFLVTLQRGSPHGGPFAYRSCETDVLGWACERAGGARMPELMSELVWSRLGVEHDADMSVDGVGTAVHDGGLSTTMRDLARFGQLLLDEGQSSTGERVLPASWIRDTLNGDPDSRQAFADSPTDTQMPGGMYRNQFWVPYADREVLLCIGIHGQMVYVNPAARMVGVKLSSWPVPQDAALLAATLKAFDAVADYLQAQGAGASRNTSPLT
jgi:CubicO group peptidase (beta-lactamase class C family)